MDSAPCHPERSEGSAINVRSIHVYVSTSPFEFHGFLGTKRRIRGHRSIISQTGHPLRNVSGQVPSSEPSTPDTTPFCRKNNEPKGRAREGECPRSPASTFQLSRGDAEYAEKKRGCFRTVENNLANTYKNAGFLRVFRGTPFFFPSPSGIPLTSDFFLFLLRVLRASACVHYSYLVLHLPSPQVRHRHIPNVHGQTKHPPSPGRGARW